MVNSLTGTTSIKDIHQKAKFLSELEKIKVGGLESLQLVIYQKNFSSQADLLEKINFASSLVVNGQLSLTPEREQICELRVSEIEFINSNAEDYPLQKKSIPLEVVRDYPHLRAKTNYFLVIFRLRNSISKAIHEFFNQEGFYYISTPIITSNDAEGAGELFNLTTSKKDLFFSKPAKLTVSGQLQAEALVQGLESEMVFTDLKGIIRLAEKMIKYVTNYVLNNNSAELKYLENYDEKNEKKIIGKLKKLADESFKKIDYGERMDLQSEHEKFLCQHFNNSPVFITNYPTNLKAFYMKNNPNGKTVSCFDLLLPEVGELVGGSMREDNYRILRDKAQKIGLDINNLNWYFDLRKYGYAPSGGFGLGLERLIMFISGTENIRDTIAFPRCSS
ncbi:8409_t:CDS:2 [Ambispora leptoticha]|uniref:8409_t:CDS:1 n=1 Tax=Ambispora leptoticha TaxID=144679 RepID=A0A9N8YPF9_9GLOM|nr:8409_t:CDS:2 [Ambispora leptoticha]